MRGTLSISRFGRALVTALSAAAAAAELGFATEYGDLLTTGQSTIRRGAAQSTLTLTSGRVRLGYFTARKSETVVSLRTVATGAAGATPTLGKVGLYTEAANGDLTRVAATANTTSLWATAAPTGYETALTASYAVTKGVRYAVAVLCVTSATAPTIGCEIAGLITETPRSPRQCGHIDGQTDLPSSISAGSIIDSTLRPYAVLLP